MLLGLALVASMGWASEPVVHAAGESDPVGAASRIAGRDPATLHAAPLGELMADREPVTVEGPDLIGCGGVPEGQDRLREILDQAERHVLNANKGASAALKQAELTMRCLREVLDPKLGARVFFLEGVVAARAGDKATALDRFRQAVVLEVGLAWDPSFEPAVHEIFKAAVDTALAEQQRAQVSIVPHPGEKTVWIDGMEFPPSRETVALAAGRHYVQIARPLTGGVTTGELVVGQEEVVKIAVPSAVGGDVLRWAGVEGRAADLGALLTVAIEPGDDVLILTRGEVYEGLAGGTSFRQIGSTDPANTSAALMASGGAAMGVGAGLAVFSFLRVSSLASTGTDAANALDLAARDDAARGAATWRTMTYVGAGVGVAGAAVLTAGVVPTLLDGRAAIVPVVGPRAAGASLVIR